ncbi:myosin light chain kinase, smooth muscle-like [Patiria miniata]|uniref:Myosin light chain kinase n=1 Tax=Patiria miniata TaxID=46514 RepID=A0A913Z894_PATMI|nr:myosin light chain kinase, smooth muscle-like [Patiria miniata]XP_038047066.1 myosin light chain kinase, smooth muscle-like [Patiria miniata]
MPAEAPEPPANKPYAAKVFKDMVNLVWPGTTYDGGSIVTGYQVEMCEDGKNNWKVLTKNVFSTSYAIKGLKENCTYKFRVCCVNAVGTSKPSIISEPIMTSETAEDDVDEEDEPDEAAFEQRKVKVRKENVKDMYEIREELGRGKFGTVNKCVEKKTKKMLAAKFIKAEKPADKKECEHEIEIMMVLQHPKLLQLYDAFATGNNMVMILEYVSGGELFERVIDEEFDLTEKEVTFFMRQICEGVKFMHAQKILHLDMKPENILCVRKNSNKIKIIDFGLAQKMTKGLKVSCGTPEFLAPEVVSYDEVAYTTDMWSVGVICYVLLSGLSPFMGDNEGETMSNILKVEWDFDDECFDDISDMSKNFIENLLKEDKSERMTADQCLNDDWLKKEIKSTASLSKARLKKYVIKRRWLKAINAVRAMIRVKGIL